MTKTYFVHFELGNNPANRLQKAIQEHFNGYQNFTITDPDLFFLKFQDVVRHISAQHPRCRPEKADIYYLHPGKSMDQEHVIYVSGVVRFLIRLIEASWDIRDGYQPLMMSEETCSGNCGMNYCDENGCIERKRVWVDPAPMSSVPTAASEKDEPKGGAGV